jgi:hypothetical protein
VDVGPCADASKCFVANSTLSRASATRPSTICAGAIVPCAFEHWPVAKERVPAVPNGALVLVREERTLGGVDHMIETPGLRRLRASAVSNSGRHNVRDLVPEGLWAL